MNWNKVKKLNSTDKNVAKFVFENDTAVAEAVLYKYPTYEDRTVICCSTQSGCPIGCRFCGAGDSFVRSLSSIEIKDQVTHLLDQTSVDPNKMNKLQIMFMSMGEPMLNQKSLVDAMYDMNKMWPNADLLVSTSAPRVEYHPFILESCSNTKIGLQFSIHESTDEARNKLIPFKKKLTLKEIAEVGTKWAISTGRQPFFNYCVHDGNNTDDDADRLVELFDPDIWQCTLSVVCERTEHVAAANERQHTLVVDFASKMLKHGMSSRIFNPAGQDDIGGGCGQLWYVQDWMKNNPDKARPSVGRSLPVIHCPQADELSE